MRRGDRVAVYEDPMTESRFDFHATLRRCVKQDAGSIEGRLLQRWIVLPDGDGAVECEVAILVPEPPAPVVA